MTTASETSNFCILTVFAVNVPDRSKFVADKSMIKALFAIIPDTSILDTSKSKTSIFPTSMTDTFRVVTFIDVADKSSMFTEPFKVVIPLTSKFPDTPKELVDKSLTKDLPL